MTKNKECTPISLCIDSDVYLEYKKSVNKLGFKLKHVNSKLFLKAVQEFIKTGEVAE